MVNRKIIEDKKFEVEKMQVIDTTHLKNNKACSSHDSLKFSVESRVIMEDVMLYLQQKSIEFTIVQDLITYEFIFTIKNVTEAEVSALDFYLKRKEVVVKMRNAGEVILGITSAVVKVATNVSVSNIVNASTTKLAIDITGKKVEFVTEIGANVVVRIRDNYKSSVRNLSNSQDVMEAKEIISSSWDAMKCKFGGNKDSRFR